MKSRTANLLRQLARAFEVTALCFYRRETLTAGSPEAAVAGLQDVGSVEAFPIPQEHSRLRLLMDHAESALRSRVYTVPAHRSRAFGKRVSEAVQSGRYDLVHADSLDLSGWFDRLGDLPVVCGHHDVQSLLLQRRAEHEGSWLRRRYLAHQSRLMRDEERRWCPRVALNTCVSEVDRRAFEAIAPQGRYMVVPNGMDLRHHQASKEPGHGLLFIGSAGWLPNLDAMRFYAESIRPCLAGRTDAVLTWVGSAGQQERTALGGSDIKLVGHVPDTRPYLEAAACCVVPLRMGSGTRIKILEAWAMGRAVVSTSIGCEGLDARDGENILVRDEPGAFAAAIEAVLDDVALRRRLGTAGRSTVEAQYDWDRIGTAMNDAYLELVKQ